tara:strand:- start:398 stop:598 length:201 start_codon:yes stop_codon:yes gene_type:complete
MTLSNFWTITEEISRAIKVAKSNPFMEVTIQVPSVTTKLSADLTLNELSMFEEAATRVIVQIVTVH